MRPDQRPSRAVVLAVGVLSGAALAYEILLIRLFAIIEWHHLAFLVISLALLGYGASGTLLALLRDRILKAFTITAACAAAAFGAMAVGSFLIVERMDFNSLEIIWSTRQLAKLFLLYLLFAVPFFCAATSIGLTLTRFGEQSPRVYRADLIGGGCGSAAITGLLFVTHPVTALQVVACAGFAAAALFLAHEPFLRRRAVVVMLAGIAAVTAARPLLLPIRVSQYKELSQALRIPAARVIEERSSPLALLSVVESAAVPFRFAPGLSLNYAGELPQQVGVFSDGSGLTVITRYEQTSSAAYLDFVPSAAPYHLRHCGDVAIVGAGGGGEVLSALIHGATHVTAVELNPQMIDLVRRRFGSYAGEIYRDRRVRVVNGEARRFISDSTDRFDLIQIALVDSFAGSAAGVHALAESYLYTVESLADMLAHLRRGGYLVITRWTQVPPRDVVKLLATSAVAIEKLGLRPARSIALVRTWNTASVIVKRGELDPNEVAALRRFCEARSFDLDYAPGLRREETNRTNVLGEPLLFDLASALVSGDGAREELFDRYKFFIRPATDDRPYFFHFFKWRVFPELLRLRGRGGMPLVEWGYVILIAAIVQALIAATIFLLVPLLLLRRRTSTSLVRLAVYFGSTGLGFLFLEIAFIQQLTLFLGHPLYAVAIVLSSLLVFAGLGSGVVERLRRRAGERALKFVPLIVGGVALIELPLVRLLLHTTLGLPPIAKVAISIAVVAPLAFFMGMPFPSELRRLAEDDAAAVPWAWGINGTASVLSSMFATLIAVHFGFSIVIAAAVLLYGLATWSTFTIKPELGQPSSSADTT
jgi:Spermine/spermidine synthase domain